MPTEYPLVLYITQLTQRVNGVNAVCTHNMFADDSSQVNSSQQINSHFVANVLPAINAAQGGHVENVSAYTRCPTTGIDSYFTNLTGGGERAVTAQTILPAYLTVSIRWLLDDFQHGAVSPVLKRSFTRLSGLLDADVISGRLNSEWSDDYLDDIGDAWALSTLLSGETFYSCAHVNPTEGANTWRIKGINGVMSARLGTQNSRKS